jgi:hypothetical protein
MQARAYRERFAAAAEVAKQAMDGSSNGSPERAGLAPSAA